MTDQPDFKVSKRALFLAAVSFAFAGAARADDASTKARLADEMNHKAFAGYDHGAVTSDHSIELSCCHSKSVYRTVEEKAIR